MSPKSHTLFHFTKTNDVLKMVIKNGFWPRYCLEDVGWLGYPEFDFIAYNKANHNRQQAAGLANARLC